MIGKPLAHQPQSVVTGLSGYSNKYPEQRRWTQPVTGQARFFWLPPFEWMLLILSAAVCACLMLL